MKVGELQKEFKKAIIIDVEAKKVIVLNNDDIHFYDDTFYNKIVDLIKKEFKKVL